MNTIIYHVRFLILKKLKFEQKNIGSVLSIT